MYRSIIDSGWVDVEALTVLVGKNEVGKTSLLRALHKLNPFSPDSYSMDSEWPRGRRTDRNPDQPVCVARFELTEAEVRDLEGVAGIDLRGKMLEISRDYAGKLSFNLPEGAPQPKAVEWLTKRIPTFIYMSDYRAFTGSAQLDQVRDRKNRNQLSEEDKTILMIMKLAGLDLNQEVAKGSSPNREQRQYDLDDASTTLTNLISDRWKQRRYQVQFRADGQYFYTFVKDEKDPSLIRLEERSQGFQWFFSFDMMFMHESQGTFRGCVILLDEPGLHLHPDAQRDLLVRLEEYAKENTVLYTTHLPFVIDLRKPERIRVLSESRAGTKVSSDLTTTEPNAKFVLQAALGMSGSSSYLLSKQNLVVEGVDDFWIISELTELLERSGSKGLPDDVFITPAGGASEAAYIATFMIGQKLDVVVLLDSDSAGDSARDNLVKRWITRYSSSPAQILSLGQVVGEQVRPFAIEDLFSDEFYLALVTQAYKKELGAAGISKLELNGNGLLRDRVGSALEKMGITFNKGTVAKLLRKNLASMKSFGDLPEDTQERARKLVETLRSAFE